MNEEIQELVRDLDNWRQSKDHRRGGKEKIPEEFWQRAVSLYKKYPRSSIKNLCRFNASSWNKKLEKNTFSGPQVKGNGIDLIELPRVDSTSLIKYFERIAVQSSHNPIEGRCQVEIAFESGFTVRIWK